MKLTQDVYEETRKAAIAYGVPELALKMGIGNPGVLYNKLNHGDSCSHHKLTLADLIQIITITGNTVNINFGQVIGDIAAGGANSEAAQQALAMLEESKNNPK